MTDLEPIIFGSYQRMSDLAGDTYFAVRCYTCNKVLGNKQRPYENLLAQGLTPEQAMDRLGIDRYCCRRHVLNPIVMPIGSNVELDNELIGITTDMNELRAKGGGASHGVLILRPSTSAPRTQINTSTLQVTQLPSEVVMSIPPPNLPTIASTSTSYAKPSGSGIRTQGVNERMASLQIRTPSVLPQTIGQSNVNYRV